MLPRFQVQADDASRKVGGIVDGQIDPFMRDT